MLPPHFVVPEGDKVSHEALLNDAAKALREKTIAPALALSTQLESKLNEIADHEKRQHDNLGKLEKEIQACDDESKRLQEHLDSTLANVLYTSRRSALLLNLGMTFLLCNLIFMIYLDSAGLVTPRSERLGDRVWPRAQKVDV